MNESLRGESLLDPAVLRSLVRSLLSSSARGLPLLFLQRPFPTSVWPRHRLGQFGEKRSNFYYPATLNNRDLLLPKNDFQGFHTTWGNNEVSRQNCIKKIVCQTFLISQKDRNEQPFSDLEKIGQIRVDLQQLKKVHFLQQPDLSKKISYCIVRNARKQVRVRFVLANVLISSWNMNNHGNSKRGLFVVRLHTKERAGNCKRHQIIYIFSLIVRFRRCVMTLDGRNLFVCCFWSSPTIGQASYFRFFRMHNRQLPVISIAVKEARYLLQACVEFLGFLLLSAAVQQQQQKQQQHVAFEGNLFLSPRQGSKNGAATANDSFCNQRKNRSIAKLWDIATLEIFFAKKRHLSRQAIDYEYFFPRWQFQCE